MDPDNERDFRWERIRAQAQQEEVDLLVLLPESSPTDVLYAAGEVGVVFFPPEGEPEILLAGEDSHLAVERTGWIRRRRSATPNGSTKVPYGQIVAAHLRTHYPRVRRLAIAGIAGNAYSHVRSADGYAIYATVQAIAAALPDTCVVDGSTIMARARRVKSAQDIHRIADGITIAESGADAITAAFHVGATQAEVHTAGIVGMIRPGLNLPTVAWCPGVWGLPRPRIVSTPPGVIDAELCVATEIMPGYRDVVQIAEPFLAKPPDAMQLDIFDLNVAAFDTACAAMVPGATWREVHDRVTAVADGTEFGLTFLLHSGFDGPLFIPNDLPVDVLDDRIEEGGVYVCKPTAFPRSEPGVKARSFDMSWGDMITVGPAGARRLGSRPQVLREVWS